MKTLNGIVVRSEKEEFGVLIVEADGASGEKGKDPSDSEDSVKGRVSTLGGRRRPMEKAVT